MPSLVSLSSRSRGEQLEAGRKRGVERKNPIPIWQTPQHRSLAPHNAFVENFSGPTRIHVYSGWINLRPSLLLVMS